MEENVLRVRVKSLEVLKNKEEQYWPDYIKYNIKLIEKYGTDTTNTFVDATLLNNFVFDGIFMHSDDSSQFTIGLRWMEGVLRRNPNYPNHIDTYANLLYKAGRREEAIQWQEKAVKIAIETKDMFLDNIQNNLVKMKKNEQTWKSSVSTSN